MKVVFNRRVRRMPWGGGAHFHSAMVDLLLERGHTVTDRLEDDVDVVFMLDPREEEHGFGWRAIEAHKRTHPNARVLHRVNECDARNGGANDIDRQLIEANSVADATVFISGWLRDHLAKRGLNPPSSEVVYNGCRLDWFYPAEGKPETLVGIGRKIRLVTHHWSNNRRKGFDFYDSLDAFVRKDPRFEFTYVGRYSPDFSPKNTRVLMPRWGSELGDELRKHDVYVTASMNEPCGMHHLEGAASGLPVLFHQDGGGIVERAREHGLPFWDKASFKESLERIVVRYGEFCRRISRDELSMRRCGERYLSIMEGSLA